jgi:hypothetical protein
MASNSSTKEIAAVIMLNVKNSDALSFIAFLLPLRGAHSLIAYVPIPKTASNIKYDTTDIEKVTFPRSSGIKIVVMYGYVISGNMKDNILLIIL